MAGRGDAIWDEMSEFANSLYVMTEINCCNPFFSFFFPLLEWAHVNFIWCLLSTSSSQLAP